ncbi:MAG: hypothetical protein KAJ17_05665, partial [Candidatus Krumholzibacteria bacterium]|nr:hypothetical protein [Candidatus Krumholzibacteria bacterium]
MNLARRFWRGVVPAAVTISLSIGGCGADDDQSTIRFWQFWDVAVIEPMIEQFEAEHPGIRVEVEQLTWKSGLE